MSSYSLKDIYENTEENPKLKTAKNVLKAGAVGGVAGGIVGANRGINQALSSDAAQNKFNLARQGLERGKAFGKAEGYMKNTMTPGTPQQYDDALNAFPGIKSDIAKLNENTDEPLSNKQKLINIGKKYALPVGAAVGVGKLTHDKVKDSTNSEISKAVDSISDKGAFRAGLKAGKEQGLTDSLISQN